MKKKSFYWVLAAILVICCAGVMSSCSNDDAIGGLLYTIQNAVKIYTIINPNLISWYKISMF